MSSVSEIKVYIYIYIYVYIYITSRLPGFAREEGWEGGRGDREGMEVGRGREGGRRGEGGLRMSPISTRICVPNLVAV